MKDLAKDVFVGALVLVVATGMVEAIRYAATEYVFPRLMPRNPERRIVVA